MIIQYIERQLRRSLHTIPKRIRRIFSGTSTRSHFTCHPKYKILLTDGFVKLENNIDINIINKWKRDYLVSKPNFTPAEGNISYPFYNAEIHKLLSDSEMVKVVRHYFQKVYGKLPVLQMIPKLVITYPIINQESFQLKNNHFPAVWHIDYRSEFTVHIPLVDITINTSHTKYIRGSQCSFTTPPALIVYENNYPVTNCFAEPGDTLLIDVDGWHRAQLERNSFRAMIQLKYTVGNDMLHYKNSEKLQGYVDDAVTKCKHYSNLQLQLINDREYIRSLDLTATSLSILENNIQYYAGYTPGNN